MFTITFTFSDREPENLEKINSALRGMRLSSMKIKDYKGYLATTTTYDNGRPAGKSYAYGFDSMALECNQDQGEGPYTYQIDARAVPKAVSRGSDAYHDQWCAAHPDRIMRTLIQVSFDDADAYIVSHHERKK